MERWGDEEEGVSGESWKLVDVGETEDEGK